MEKKSILQLRQPLLLPILLSILILPVYAQKDNELFSANNPYAKKVSIKEHEPENFPCSECHKQIKLSAPNELEDHDDIDLKHMDDVRHCTLCHNKTNADTLNLQDGKVIPFEKSMQLCAQCHGIPYRNWEKGLHGLQSGGWNLPKIRMLCVECHNPHNPKFKKMKATPMPQRKSEKAQEKTHE